MVILKRLKGDLPIVRSWHMVTNPRSERGHQSARDRCAVGAASSAVSQVRLAIGHVMIDTGCRRDCGGRGWHRALRCELSERGAAYKGRRVQGHFQFGPGSPVVASTLYTVVEPGAETQLII